MTHGRAARLAEWLVESGYASIVLDRMVRQACQMVAAEGSSIFVPDPSRSGVAIAVAGCGVDEEIVGSRFATAEGLVGRVLASAKPRVSSPALPEGAEGNGGHAGAAVPIRREGEVRGALAAEAEGPHHFGPRELAVLSGVAAVAGAALVHAERRAGAEPNLRARISGLVEAIDARDGYTAAHSETVVELSRSLGERLRLSGPDLLELELAALFHDLGKVGVPEAILGKPAPLDPEEQAIMRHHCEWGAQILARVPGLEPVATIVRCHHERWDGSGYPDALKGEQIPLASRVVAVCDAYDAMTSERPYRMPLTHAEAIAELQGGAGSQFDPALVDLLLTVLDERERS